MYRPSKYNDHNDSLSKFVRIFNEYANNYNVFMTYNENENFSDDGKIILINEKKQIYYDWEKRFKYFSNGNFVFDTLGQFERKFQKNPSIGITIQCDEKEENILVSLHSFFDTSNSVSRKTDTINEIGKMRTTKNFKIYKYNEIDKFVFQILKWAEEDLIDFYNITGGE